MKRLIFIAILLFSPLAVAQDQPLRLVYSESPSAADAAQNFGPFAAALGEVLKRPVLLEETTGRQMSLTAAETADLIVASPNDYVTLRQRNPGIRPLLAITREDYFATVVVLRNSNIRLANELKGKSVAFGGQGSTSSHLGPMQALADLGMLPGKDYEALHLHWKEAFGRLVTGDITAIGIGSTMLPQMRELDPNALLRVIARSRDLPDDLIAVGAGVDEETMVEWRSTLILAQPKLMAALLKGPFNKKYNGSHLSAVISNNDYNTVRAMARLANLLSLQ